MKKIDSFKFFFNPFNIGHINLKYISIIDKYRAFLASIVLIAISILVLIIVSYVIDDNRNNLNVNEELLSFFENNRSGYIFLHVGILGPLVEEYLYRYFIVTKNIFFSMLSIINFIHFYDAFNYTSLISLFINIIVIISFIIFFLYVFVREKKITADIVQQKYLFILIFWLSFSFSVLHLDNYLSEAFNSFLLLLTLIFQFIFSIIAYKLRIHIGMKYALCLHIGHNSTLSLLYLSGALQN